MTAAIQYILTTAQSLGYKKSRMTIFRLAGGKTSRHRQNGLSYVLKKILTWKVREARGGLKATLDIGVTTGLYPHSFLFFSVFFFNQSIVFPSRVCSKACQHILDIVGLSQANLRIIKAYQNIFIGNNYLTYYAISLYH